MYRGHSIWTHSKGALPGGRALNGIITVFYMDLGAFPRSNLLRPINENHFYTHLGLVRHETNLWYKDHKRRHEVVLCCIRRWLFHSGDSTGRKQCGAWRIPHKTPCRNRCWRIVSVVCQMDATKMFGMSVLIWFFLIYHFS